MINICSFNTVEVYLKMKKGFLEILLTHDKINIASYRLWVLIIFREY